MENEFLKKVIALNRSLINPSTMIKYYVPQSGHITTNIYYVMGQKIETRVDANISAETHEVRWAPKNLASGVYL
jgi:hypothetical protein